MKIKLLFEIIGAITILILVSFTSVVGIQSTQSISTQNMDDGPDIKFTRSFKIEYGIIHEWSPVRYLACEICNRGTKDIEFWGVLGSGRLLLNIKLTGGVGTYICPPGGHIRPDNAVWINCLDLPFYAFWPELAYVRIYIGTGGNGSGGPITDANFVSGIFLFWGSKVLPVLVSYQD
jgi:hypothetical protein